MKRIFGYIFIIIAAILAFAVVGQLSKFLGSILDIVRIATGKLDSYQTGRAVGAFAYWLLHIALTSILWITGRKWVSRRTN